VKQRNTTLMSFGWALRHFDEFWLGFTSFSYQLRFDGMVLVFILPLIVGLFVAARWSKSRRFYNVVNRRNTFDSSTTYWVYRAYKSAIQVCTIGCIFFSRSGNLTFKKNELIFQSIGLTNVHPEVTTSPSKRG
jgi:hypothetical protein